MAPEALAELLSETAFKAIVVMPGYRVNAFGFLAGKELENEASDSEDETRWQYLSDDEGPAIPHDDEDDDSDLD